MVGQGEGDEFSLPVSQALIADAVGLSFVHVNRVMRAFESEGLIERSRETLILRDRDALAEISGFSDAYLHLDADPRRLALERA
ncbi:MAG: helix-turn-helix domain-containing protein [Parvularculaceae bacterium]